MKCCSFVVRHGTKWSAVLRHFASLRGGLQAGATSLRFVADYEQTPLRFASWRTTSRRRSASLRGGLRTNAAPLRFVADYKQAPLRFASWRTTNKRRSASLRGGLRTSAMLRFASWRTTSRRRSASLRGGPQASALRFASWRTTSERTPLRFVADYKQRRTSLRFVADYEQTPLRFASWRTTSARSASLRGGLRAFHCILTCSQARGHLLRRSSPIFLIPSRISIEASARRRGDGQNKPSPPLGEEASSRRSIAGRPPGAPPEQVLRSH